MIPLLLLTLVTLGYLWREHRLSRASAQRIAYRIHVNGSRGKSSVTRLIAAGLRAGGLRTMAKTTGSAPRLIHPDGTETPIRRIGKPSIREQIGVLGTAARHKVDALVLECMALDPLNQWICEHRIIRATHGVCTNVRADHLDVMGPTVADVERALAGTVPDEGVFITAEPEHTKVFEAACQRQQTRFVPVTEDDASTITADELNRFSYLEHPANVALALRVAGLVGVEREVALGGMVRATPDIGALTRCELDFFGRRIRWFNAFAANDPDSYRLIWARLRSQLDEADRRLVVINTREDRPDRSRQLAVLAAELDNADHIFLVGTGTEVFARTAMNAGMTPERLTNLEMAPVARVFERIISQCGKSSVVVGMGNIKGPGALLDEYFHNRAGIQPGA